LSDVTRINQSHYSIREILLPPVSRYRNDFIIIIVVTIYRSIESTGALYTLTLQFYEQNRKRKS